MAPRSSGWVTASTTRRWALDADESIHAGDVTLVPCDRLHDLEVYTIYRLRRRLPRLGQPAGASNRVCEGFRPFVGVSYGRSTQDFWAYYPTDASWKLSTTTGSPAWSATRTARRPGR